ncbi:MAG: hypothetical protein MUF84_04370 [Anaerolineae bacterium]|nr:hypothetical protein [Anaerolineae bacterium]
MFTIGAWIDRSLLALSMMAVVGYFGPWVARQPVSAALSWNAYDLFDLLRLLPEVQSGALVVNPQALQLPLLALAVLLPALAYRAPALVRVGAAVIGSGLATLTLPPYPEILTAWRTPGWRVPFWWGVGAVLCTWIVGWAGVRLGKSRHWLPIAAAELAVFPAAVTLFRLMPALRELHAAHVRPGWGFWVCITGLGLVGVLAGLRACVITDG